MLIYNIYKESTNHILEMIYYDLLTLGTVGQLNIIIFPNHFLILFKEDFSHFIPLIHTLELTLHITVDYDC